MIVTWSFPTTIVFGAGALATLADHVKRIGGKRALVVCDAGVRKAGIADRVSRVLERRGHRRPRVRRGRSRTPSRRTSCDGVVAYRDASAPTSSSRSAAARRSTPAKLIALKTTHERPLVDYDDATGGDRFITANVPPIIAIPTTAGTGSEVGRSGVVTLAATGRKTVIFSPHLLAKVAILDPELTRIAARRASPRRPGSTRSRTASRRTVALGDHPMADAIALGGLELCAKHLERAVSTKATTSKRAAA